MAANTSKPSKKSSRSSSSTTTASTTSFMPSYSSSSSSYAESFQAWSQIPGSSSWLWSSSTRISSPLTTIFTPAASCDSDAIPTYYSCKLFREFWTDSNASIPVCSISYKPGCLPSGYAETIFSPGVCPLGYQTSPKGFVVPSSSVIYSDPYPAMATTRFCCPESMTLAGFYEDYVCMNVATRDYVVHSTTEPTMDTSSIGWAGFSIPIGPTATSGAVALYQPPIKIAWASDDLVKFTPVSAPLLQRPGSSTLSTGVEGTAFTSADASVQMDDGVAMSHLSTLRKTGIGIGIGAGGLIAIAVICWCIIKKRWKRQGKPVYESLATDTSAQSDAISREMDTPNSPFRSSTLREKKLRYLGSWTGWRQLILCTWLPEVIALGFSIACLFTIITVLGFYDGQLKPTVRLGLTLNALVALLSTASKASLLFAVAAAIGQLKWVRLVKARRLNEVSIFDEASRGPLGAMILLNQVHFRSWASIGATVTILALAIDPAVQQLLKYPVRAVTKPSPRVTAAGSSVFRVYPTSTSFEFALNSAIWTIDGSIYEQSPRCPSGNCKWPAYTSMGWCSKCMDVTASTALSDCNVHAWTNGSFSNLECRLSVGQGRNLTVIRGYPSAPDGRGYNDTDRRLEWITSAVWSIMSSTDAYSFDFCSASNAADEMGYLGIRTPLLVLGHARPVDATMRYDVLTGLQLTNDIRFTVEECVLSLCTRTNELVMEEGILRQDLADVNFGAIGKQWVIPPVHSGHGGPLCAECWQPDDHDVEYSVTLLSTESPKMEYLLDTLFENRSSHAFCTPEPISIFQAPISNLLSGEAWKYTETSLNSTTANTGFKKTNGGVLPIIQQMGLGYTVSQVAASLTKVGMDTSGEIITGNVTTSEVFVQVRWMWLILPLALEVLGILFLAVAIILGRKHHINLWKSSVLPLVFHTSDAEAIRSSKKLLDIDAMEDSAKATMARMSNVDGSQKLVIAPQ